MFVQKSQIRLAVVVVVAVLAASCATVPPSQREKRIELLIAELNGADEERLVTLSAQPFLLDGEIVALESDIRTLWGNLRGVGFTFDAAQIRAITPVDERSFQRFASTMDVQVFFQKYLSDDAAVVELQTRHGTFLVLTGSRVGRVPKIFGFTGPGGL